MKPPSPRAVIRTLLLLTTLLCLASRGTAQSPGGSGKKGDVTIDLGGGMAMEFVLIRPGSFQMGSDKDANAKAAHKVTITKPFYIGKYPVTQEQWQRVMGENPSYFKGAKNPVEMVSWDDCQSFMAKLKEKAPTQTFRLPTEAEWEYACRAGTTTDYIFGDTDAALGDYAWFNANSLATTHPVGGKKPNAWGLYDMLGNVWEWCSDWFVTPYPPGDQIDPVGAFSIIPSHVMRGGSWNLGPRYPQSAHRERDTPECRDHVTGLRCVFVPTP